MGTLKRSLLLKIFMFLAISAACIGLTACQDFETSPLESTKPHLHTFTHYDGKTATCTEAGYKAYDVCSGCGYSTYEEIPAYGHTEVIDKGEPATCIKPGITDGKHCSVCSTVLVKQEIIPATGHTPGDWIVDKNATRTENGKKHKVCTTCGETTETEIIPATGSIGLSYSINDDGKTCSVTGIGECTDTEVCIPQTNPEGYTVTAIVFFG